jgi:RNA polymerase sigma-70 factor (ECF subfamily)
MGLSRQTSLSLLERAGTQDPAAWGRIVSLYAPLVAHWCLRQGVRRQDCDEVAQETFLAVHANLASFERERVGSFRAWVRGIVRYKALDHFRRQRQEPAAAAAGGTEAHRQMADLSGPADDEEDDAAELSGLYRRALSLIQAEFEPRTWQAFWRAAVDGQATDVVAGELGMSAVAVRIAKSRVLARLREEVGQLID